jgi:hypothetical protein
MKRRDVALGVLALAVAGGMAAAKVLDRLPGVEEPDLQVPDEAVATYLRAMDRGELVLFGLILDRSMLSPVQVEYVYTFDGEAPRVKVFSRLTRTLPAPGDSGCTIRGVSAILDADGHIVEIEAHIWPE